MNHLHSNLSGGREKHGVHAFSVEFEAIDFLMPPRYDFDTFMRLTQGELSILKYW